MSLDLFHPEMSVREVNEISSLGLAHIGDAVYEILVRTYLITSGSTTGAHLHKDTTSLVNAGAQAEAADRILPLLSRTGGAFRRNVSAGPAEPAPGTVFCDHGGNSCRLTLFI